MRKFVYNFKEGNQSLKEILGGKGANLSEMTNLGLPVPKGLIVSTEACVDYLNNNNVLNENIKSEILKNIKELEKETNKKFNDLENPLLISIRSGSRASMPGMMDTILNLGLNDEIVESLIKKTNNKRFVLDSYRRLIEMYSDVVMNINMSNFNKIFDSIKQNNNISLDTELTGENLEEIVKLYKKLYKDKTGNNFPSDPIEQLISSIEAVFKSWNNERAITYRRINNIPSNWGTAVNIQEMVYGNLNNSSGTGVLFTRNPSTGENKLYGEYLINAQGEDVVAGVRTPNNIALLAKEMPDVYKELYNISKKLELHYKDMQDMEFTIENNKLYILQTRNGKRTGVAALKIALDFYKEGVITKEEAILQVEPKLLDQLLHPTFIENELSNSLVIGSGLAASPGAAYGKVYFDSKVAHKAYLDGEKEIILVRLETSPEDIDGMVIANGILTLRGGMTSHAAVVARGMGKPCVTGSENMKIENQTLISKDNLLIKEGEYISIDGTSGKVYKGKLNTEESKLTDEFKTFISYADEIRTLKIRANADTEANAKEALNFGAEGIGLCRTEHMFFEPSRLKLFRKMILSTTIEEREKYLNEILNYQYNDFLKIFKVMHNLPITIRYLDPPLHEFLPNEDNEIESLSKELTVTKEELLSRINKLKEFNPMLGHRGVRLSITYPEITIMQTRAILKAAVCAKKEGIIVKPELMIPLVSEENEFKYIVDIIKKVIEEETKEVFVNVLIGTMIETPRSCIIANDLSKQCDFFSFGTNDLTQMTYGFSRDDATKFLDDYYQKQIFTSDPFETIDTYGVGELLKISVSQAKRHNSSVELGICGEHGGDPKSVVFCHDIGLDYVSCSPYRIPIAKVSAAQSQLRNPRQ